MLSKHVVEVVDSDAVSADSCTVLWVPSVPCIFYSPAPPKLI